jgi:O-antigen/teichoic acid export membrane protein
MTAKKFINQVSLLIILNLIVKLIWVFFIERNIQLKVGFAEYGLYYSIFNFTLVLSVIADPGLSNFMVKKMASGNQEDSHFSFLSVKIVLSVIYLAFTLITAYLLNYTSRQLLLVLVAYQVLWSFLIYLRSYLKVNQLFYLDAVFSVLDKLLLVLALFPILAFADDFLWSTIFYASCQLITLFISIVVCTIVLYQNQIDIFKAFWLKLDFKVVKPLIPFAIFAFLVLAHQKIDSMMLEKIAENGPLETGIYAAAYRFLDAATMVPILFASFLYPLLANLIGQQKMFNNLVNNSMKLLGAFSIIISISAWFYRTEIMDLFYGKAFSQDLALVFGLLMFTVFFQTVYYVYSSVFTANNNLKLLCYISLTSLAINIILNIILIPIYAALGAAISNLISFGVMALVYIFTYSQYFHFKPNYTNWFKLFALVVLMCFTAYFLNYMAFNWMVSLAVLLIAGLAISFLLRLINVEDLREFV